MTSAFFRYLPLLFSEFYYFIREHFLTFINYTDKYVNNY